MAGDAIEIEGIVESRSHQIYTVRADVAGVERVILAKLSGRVFTHRIRVIPGDRVRVEVSPYDLSRGRITYRL